MVASNRWNTSEEDFGHWSCHDDMAPDPGNHFGFVYEIHNMKDDRRYIGKKNYWFKNSKKKTIIKDMNNPKFNLMEWKKSDWMFYTGSCKPLNKDIEEYGKDQFKFKLLSQWKSANALRYIECRLQWMRRVLESDYYYNNSIGEIKFPMPQELKNE